MARLHRGRSRWRFGFILAYTICLSVHAKEVRIAFTVEVPRHYSGIDTLYLSGNHAALGNWNPKGLRLQKMGELFFGAISLPSLHPLEFKINLGNWFHAEVLENGGERPNRKVNCLEDCSPSVKVANFRQHLFHPVPKSVTHNVRYHYDFYAKDFDNWRNLAVYLPPQYFSEPDRRFGVLYALDGNNLFDRATASSGEEWSLDETLDRLISSGEIPPLIVVGIYSTPRRADEYLYCRNERLHLGGMADRFGHFLGDIIKPFIDGKYRTLGDRKHTALMGSSFGGHFTLFAAWNFGSLFSKYAALSTAYWWDNYCIHSMIRASPSVPPEKLWIDMGDREGCDDGAVEFKNGVADTEYAHYLMANAGLIPGKNLFKFIHSGGIHHEHSWGERVPRILKWFYSK